MDWSKDVGLTMNERAKVCIRKYELVSLRLLWDHMKIEATSLVPEYLFIFKIWLMIVTTEETKWFTVCLQTVQ